MHPLRWACKGSQVVREPAFLRFSWNALKRSTYPVSWKDRQDKLHLSYKHALTIVHVTGLSLQASANPFHPHRSVYTSDIPGAKREHLRCDRQCNFHSILGPAGSPCLRNAPWTACSASHCRGSAAHVDRFSRAVTVYTSPCAKGQSWHTKEENLSG